MQAAPEDELLRGVQAIAKALRVPAAQVRQLAERHGLPVVWTQGAPCIRRSALEAWLAAYLQA